jgi:hypothetical protein
LKRHLIYHCCPLKANDIWKRNLEQLARRWSVFDGEKVVAVAQDDSCHHEEIVGMYMDELDMLGVTMIVVPNDIRLREVASFKMLLTAIKHLDGCAFYAHSKGNSTKDGVAGATRWRNCMYHFLLDKADECVRKLESGVSMVGTNKMTWAPLEPGEVVQVRPQLRKSPYPTRLDNTYQHMFAGTFFWFRLDRVFSRDWTKIANDRYGAEAWPGMLFKHTETHSMFDPFHPRHALSPYDPKYYSPEFDDPS